MTPDVSLPTVDGRGVVLARRAELEPDVPLGLKQLGVCRCRKKPPPRIHAGAVGGVLGRPWNRCARSQRLS